MKMKKTLIAVAVIAALLAAPIAYADVNNLGSPLSMFSQMTRWMGYGSGAAGTYRGATGNGYGVMGNGSGMMGAGPGMMGGYNGYSSNPGSSAYRQAQYTVSLKILPKGKKGPDGRMHDAYSPAYFTLKEGVPVQLVIYNYDDMPHSLTSAGLGLNIQAAGTQKEGQPEVTTATVIPQNAGDYKWVCVDPCDLEANGWAMGQDGFMQGTISVVNS